MQTRYMCAVTMDEVRAYLAGSKIVAFDFETAPDDPFRTEPKAALDPHKAHNNAPFVKSVEKIILLENKINAEIDTLVALKEQIHDVISTVEDQNESLILQYRYIQGQSWESIAAAMHADISSAYRWHTNALLHVKMPENPILI